MAAPSKFTEEAQKLALKLSKGGASSDDIAARIRKDLGIEVTGVAVRKRLVQWKPKPGARRAEATAKVAAPEPPPPPPPAPAPATITEQFGGTTAGDLEILDERIQKLCDDSDLTEDVKVRGALLGHLVRMLTVRSKIRPPPALDPAELAREMQRKADAVIKQIERYVTKRETAKP